eukprot:2927586-Rhodomonas_salina.4
MSESEGRCLGCTQSLRGSCQGGPQRNSCCSSSLRLVVSQTGGTASDKRITGAHAFKEMRLLRIRRVDKGDRDMESFARASDGDRGYYY